MDTSAKVLDWLRLVGGYMQEKQGPRREAKVFSGLNSTVVLSLIYLERGRRRGLDVWHESMLALGSLDGY